MITLPKQSGSRWVGIAPFAAHKGKIYPPEKMEEVVKGLINNPDVYVFLLGGGGEEQRLLETWSQNTRAQHPWPEKDTDLKQSLP